MSGGGEREREDVLKDTTSRGLCVRVRPPHTGTIERGGEGGGCDSVSTGKEVLGREVGPGPGGADSEDRHWQARAPSPPAPGRAGAPESESEETVTR